MRNFPQGTSASGEKRIYMKAIVEYPVLLREEGSANRTYLKCVFAMYNIAIDPVWESANPQALINAVEKELGIFILPEKLMKRDLLEGRIESRKLQDEELTCKAYLIWHRKKICLRS